MSSRSVALSVLVITMLGVSSAHADGLPDVGQSVQVHGFASPGFIATTQNNYLAKSTSGSVQFTEVGINFTAPLTERLTTGLQLFSRQLGPVGDFTAKVDWFYLDYRYQDWFGVRAGRVKIPFGLYNDSSDIDAARVPILLPQSMYSLTSRDFLLAQTGAEIYGRVDLRAAGAFEYRIYYGTIFIDANNQTSIGTQVQSLDVPYVAGQRLLWETPLDGLRVAGSFQSLRLNADFVYNGKPISLTLPVVLGVGSIEYAGEALLLSAEYGRWRVSLQSDDAALVPSATIVSERGYVMGSYRIASWFQPGAYYSVLFPDVKDRSHRSSVQHDVAATTRFDINSHWLMKLEGHFMSGTAGLDPSLNGNKPLDQLAKNWGVFLAKTTVYFLP